MPCKESQDKTAALDATGLCKFASSVAGFDWMPTLIDAACEGEWDMERFVLTGERIWNLERQFNLAAGLTGADDTLPKRMLEVPTP